MPGQDDESWEKLNGSFEDVQYPIYYIYNYQVKYFFINYYQLGLQTLQVSRALFGRLHEVSDPYRL